MSKLAVLQDDIFANELAVKIDRFGELTDYLAAHKKEYEQLKKELSEIASSTQSAMKYDLQGNKYRIEFSASVESKVLNVTPEEIFSLFGLAAFKVNMEAIETLEKAAKSQSVKVRTLSRKETLKKLTDFAKSVEKQESKVETYQSRLGVRIGNRRLNRVVG